MQYISMQCREEQAKSDRTREQYRDELARLIQTREDALENERKVRCADILKNGEWHRKQFCSMLGWPLNADLPREVPAVTEEYIGMEGEYEISRLQIEVLDGLHVTGLFLKLADGKEHPLVVAQHGGGGTPEHIAGILDGNTSNYNHIVERLMARRVHIFAPQLLLWNQDIYGTSYNRVEIDNRLKRLGSSITAIEIYAIMRSLDYMEHILPDVVIGMAGLSYGGFYTLFAAAADTRIRSAISCSFFNSRREYAWPDWTWFHAAETYDDAEIACLVYPRRICVQMGDKDELFAAEKTLTEAARVREYAGETKDWFDCILFEGTHEFCCDDMPMDRLVEDLLRK